MKKQMKQLVTGLGITLAMAGVFFTGISMEAAGKVSEKEVEKVTTREKSEKTLEKMPERTPVTIRSASLPDGSSEWKMEKHTLWISGRKIPEGTSYFTDIRKAGGASREVEKIVIESPVELPENSNYLFYGLLNVREIQGMDKVNTRNVTSMAYLFAGMSKLKTLDLSNFDTSQRTLVTLVVS